MHQTGVQVGDTLLGKYRVEHVLGQGGMGVVVATRHTQLNELFAIKMMLPEALAHPGAIERFLREAQACARLKGEHIARVHDVGSLENGAPYMVMEYLSGEDLGQIVQNRGALSLEDTALYVYQACEAIAEAHANGIIHRDLKPSNLFLTRRSNGTPCIKVLDFGISKEMDANYRVTPNLTKTGTCMGSPVYMPPEQMANAKSSDARSDIWSLGVILYELVTGVLPFAAELMTEIVTKVLTEQPKPPSQVRPGVPSAFDAVVMKCLDKRPRQRYQSVQELMQALGPFMPRNAQQPLWAQQTLPVHMTQTTSEWSHTGPVIPTNSKKQWVTALAVLGVVGLFGAAASFVTRSNTDKPAIGGQQAAMTMPTTASPAKQAEPESKDQGPTTTTKEMAAAVEPVAPESTAAPSTNAQPPATTKRATTGSVQKPNSAGAATARTSTPKSGVLLVPR